MTKITWKPKVDPTIASADTAVSRLIDWLYLTTRVQYIYCFSLLPWSQQKTVHPRRVAPYTPKRNLARDAEISVKVTHISIFFAFHFWSYFARARKKCTRKLNETQNERMIFVLSNQCEWQIKWPIVHGWRWAVSTRLQLSHSRECVRMHSTSAQC